VSGVGRPQIQSTLCRYFIGITLRWTDRLLRIRGDWGIGKGCPLDSKSRIFFIRRSLDIEREGDRPVELVASVLLALMYNLVERRALEDCSGR